MHTPAAGLTERLRRPVVGGCSCCGTIVLALYRKAATATQYTTRQQIARKGSSGQKRSVGMAATAWLATLMHATATCD